MLKDSYPRPRPTNLIIARVVSVSSILVVLALSVIFIVQHPNTNTIDRIQSSTDLRGLLEQQQLQVARNNAEIRNLRKMDQAIQESLDRKQHSGKTVIASLNPNDRKNIDDIKTNQAELDRRLSALEASIMASPEKAIAVPMLRQEIEIRQIQTHDDIEGLQREVGRLYTMTEWFIGLMITLALGLFGLSFTPVRSR